LILINYYCYDYLNTLLAMKGTNLFLQSLCQKSMDFDAIFTVRFRNERHIVTFIFMHYINTLTYLLTCDSMIFTHLT